MKVMTTCMSAAYVHHLLRSATLELLHRKEPRPLWQITASALMDGYRFTLYLHFRKQVAAFSGYIMGHTSPWKGKGTWRSPAHQYNTAKSHSYFLICHQVELRIYMKIKVLLSTFYYGCLISTDTEDKFRGVLCRNDNNSFQNFF